MTKVQHARKENNEAHESPKTGLIDQPELEIRQFHPSQNFRKLIKNRHILIIIQNIKPLINNIALPKIFTSVTWVAGVNKC